MAHEAKKYNSCMRLSASEPDPRQPRVNVAAALESCGIGLLILLAGGVLMLALVLGLQRQAVQGMRDARLQIALHEIKERLEADLALGFELGDSARAQALLEDALAQDRSLVAAEVFDPQGVSLFNTDRGAIGERVPEAWLAASAKPGLLWSASVDGDTAVGIAVRGPFGEVSGQVSLTSASAPLPRARVLLGAAGLLALVLGALTWFTVRRMLAARRLASDTVALEAAWQRLQASQQRLRDTLAGLGEGGQAPP